MNGAIVWIDIKRALVVYKRFGIIFQDKKFLSFSEVEFGLAQSYSPRRILIIALLFLTTGCRRRQNCQHDQQAENPIEFIQFQVIVL
jgi:hypothetical protein